MALDDTKFSNILATLLVLPIFSTLILGIVLLLYVVFNDYVMYNLVAVAEDMISNGLLSSLWNNPIAELNNLLAVIPQAVDFMFLISIVSMVFAMAFIAYRTSRNDYFDVFSYLGYGTVVFMFLLSIFKIVSDYIYDFFFNNLLKNLSVNLRYFTFYYDNMFWISLAILVLMVVINYVDFNNFKFAQKKKEEINDEI